MNTVTPEDVRPARRRIGSILTRLIKNRPRGLDELAAAIPEQSGGAALTTAYKIMNGESISPTILDNVVHTAGQWEGADMPLLKKLADFVNQAVVSAGKEVETAPSVPPSNANKTWAGATEKGEKAVLHVSSPLGITASQTSAMKRFGARLSLAVKELDITPAHWTGQLGQHGVAINVQKFEKIMKGVKPPTPRFVEAVICICQDRGAADSINLEALRISGLAASGSPSAEKTSSAVR